MKLRKHPFHLAPSQLNKAFLSSVPQAADRNGALKFLISHKIRLTHVFLMLANSKVWTQRSIFSQITKRISRSSFRGSNSYLAGSVLCSEPWGLCKARAARPAARPGLVSHLSQVLCLLPCCKPSVVLLFTFGFR